MRLQYWIKKNRLLTGLTIFIGALATLLVLWYLFPQYIYDQFIWKYFWGPILSDGLDKPMSYHGIAAAPKFTLVSEIVYGLIVAGALYGLYKLLKKWRISVDFSFFIGVLPYILYGSVVRVLEDANLFSEPLVFWFVTPLIYIQTLVLTLLSLLFAIYLHQTKLKKYTVSQIMGGIGVIVLLPFLYYILIWMTGSTWSQTDGLFLNVFFLVLGICCVIIAIVFVFFNSIKSFWKNAEVFNSPINLSIIFGHQLDGIASYISIYDPLHMGLPTYIEKHPASDLLMQLWPPLFPITKFFLVIAIIYVLDIVYKDELQSQKLFANLLKIGIFILGFAPGLRDLLRVMMGV